MSGEHNLAKKFYFKGITKGNKHRYDGQEVKGNLITDKFNAIIVTGSPSTTKYNGIIEVDHCFFVDPETVELCPLK